MKSFNQIEILFAICVHMIYDTIKREESNFNFHVWKLIITAKMKWIPPLSLHYHPENMCVCINLWF